MDVLALSEAGIAAWLAIFARVAGWAMLDPLLARLPMVLRLMIAAVLAAALLPGVTALPAVSPFSLAGLLALTFEWLLGALLALCVRIVFAATQAMLAWISHGATGGLLSLTEEQAQHSDTGLRQWAWWLAVLGCEAPLVANPLEVESFHWLTAEEMLAAENLLESNRTFLELLASGMLTLG